MAGVKPADLPQDLIERALDGDSTAFREFYHHYDPLVRWAVGLRVYRWPQVVPHFEDIVQDVWCALTRKGCKRLRYHDTTRGVPFSRFLKLIVARYGWKLAKRRLGHPEEELTPLDEEHDDEVMKRIMQIDFLERLAALVEQRLDSSDRALFHGYYVQGERLKDVGARLGINENTLYKRKGRLQKKLQQLAEELLGKPLATVRPDLVAIVLAVSFLASQGQLVASFGVA